MKALVMSITVSRILGAFSLLLITPMSLLFYTIYILCILSDIADGHIARKTKTTSDFGAFMDSIADLILIAILLFIFIPVIFTDPSFGIWIFYLIGLVIAIRLLALAIGFAKYRTLTLLHTYSNKAAGLVMACFPIFYGFLGLQVGFLIVFAAAFLSAFEELIITIRSKKLDRDVRSMFD